MAHDGAEWLPRVAEAVLAQTHPVHRVVAVDTGSRDRSGTALAELLGPGVVFGMNRDTGYPAAIASALRHPAALTPVSGQLGLASVHGRRGGPPDTGDWGGPQSGYGPAGPPAEWILAPARRL